MPKLTTTQRKRLKQSDFAYVDQNGNEHLPIHNAGHVRNALARWHQTDFESATAKDQAQKKILRAAKKFGIDVADDANVRHGSPDTCRSGPLGTAERRRMAIVANTRTIPGSTRCGARPERSLG